MPPADMDDPLAAIEGATPFVQEMLNLARQSPIGAIVACQPRIGMGLIDLLAGEDIDEAARLNVTELAHLAHERGVINDATAQRDRRRRGDAHDGLAGPGPTHRTRSAPIHRADRGTARSP